jgi:hypothetical protein
MRTSQSRSDNENKTRKETTKKEDETASYEVNETTEENGEKSTIKVNKNKNKDIKQVPGKISGKLNKNKQTRKELKSDKKLIKEITEEIKTIDHLDTDAILSDEEEEYQEDEGETSVEENSEEEEETEKIIKDIMEENDEHNKRAIEASKRRKEQEKNLNTQDRELELVISLEKQREKRRKQMSEHKWWLRETSNNGEGTLLGEEGQPLKRTLTKSDGKRREGKVESIKGSVCMTEENPSRMKELQQKENENGWYNLNFGTAYLSKGTRHNLISALTASKRGIGTHIAIDGEDSYMFDAYGRKYPMRVVDKQLRLDARLYSANGEYREITLIHDSGAASSVLRAE